MCVNFNEVRCACAMWSLNAGVTQQLIDETRLAPENVMLSDMQNVVNVGGDVQYRGSHGETPVCGATISLCSVQTCFCGSDVSFSTETINCHTSQFRDCKTLVRGATEMTQTQYLSVSFIKPRYTGVLLRFRTSDSEVVGSSLTRTAVE